MSLSDYIVPNRRTVTVTRDNMKVEGDFDSVAQFFIALDEIYKDHERELNENKNREKEIYKYFDEHSDEPVISEKGKSRKAIIKVEFKYPNTHTMARDFIETYGIKTYNPEIRNKAIGFIKSRLGGHRLTNNYRSHVLKSIASIIHNTKGIQSKKSEKPKRSYHKIDYDKLAAEYIKIPDNLNKPTQNTFLRTKLGYHTRNKYICKKFTEAINKARFGNIHGIEKYDTVSEPDNPKVV